MFVCMYIYLSISWKHHSTKQQLYGDLLLISKLIPIRRTRHAVHFWTSKDELISDVFSWIPTLGRASVIRPDTIYLQQFCVYPGCSLEDTPEGMDDKDE